MNANEFSPISKIHIMRVYAGMANPEDSLTYEKYEEELRNLLDRYRIRDTATEPPTRKDGDECGCVLAKRSDLPYGACEFNNCPMLDFFIRTAPKKAWREKR